MTGVVAEDQKGKGKGTEGVSRLAVSEKHEGLAFVRRMLGTGMVIVIASPHVSHDIRDRSWSRVDRSLH
jgi:hypothetical protein